MTTYTEAVPDVNLSLAAGFRSYVQHVISMFVNANPAILTRTADTGQIDEYTVAQPGTSATSPNWSPLPAIFRFYDSLGNDIYIALRFGVYKNTSGTANTDLGVMLLEVVLGRGTDGAGNLTGIYGSRFLMLGVPNHGTVATTRGTKTSYACCRDGFLGVVIERDMNNSNTNFQKNQCEFLAISFRSTGGAFTVYSCTNNSYGATSATVTLVQGNHYGNSIGSSSWSGVGIFGVKGICHSVEDGPHGRFEDSQHLIRKPVVPSNTTGVWNGDNNIFRIDCYHPSHGNWKDPNMLCYYNGDFSTLATLTLTVDAESRTYIFMNPSLKAYLPANMCVAMRWE